MNTPTAVIPDHFRIPAQPIPDPAAVVRGPGVRFTVLTSRLIRLEHSPDEAFEDRASQAFWYRRQPAPPFEVTRDSERIEITTEHLRLRYTPDRKGFTRSSLSIELLGTGTVWRYGDRDRTNLRGTARTLDMANGPVRLEQGLVSRAGWALVDDSASLVFDAEGWLAERRTGSEDRSAQAVDLYFFGYGHDYLGCLRDFCRVAGPMPLIPRWALGNWWSRYWAYSQDELKALMEDFRAHEAPLSVCIVDMDWHITRTGNASSGWTGYTWDPELFPDPEGFLHWLHRQGLRTALNLHPADGIHPHEAQYPEMARRLGIDPASGEPVPFDIAHPQFTAAYFELLHHPLEAQGVDFWWIDWQQGKKTRLTGLDPLWWLNHLHFLDLGRDARKRPFIFSRWGGLGNHRYPIGFSGDTFVTWESLAFQPYFTATAANVGYGWWSHDIGGHQRGIEDAELYVRWTQFGVFSPILRFHSTSNPYHERRPWGYDAETLRVARSALQLRHTLIPYLYSMARRGAEESRPLILPMYYLDPEDDAAYDCPNQYAFGSELIAAPYISPRDPDTQLSRQTIWLPAGDWFDFTTGQHRAGGRWHTLYGGLDEIPVLAKAGAIVPLGPLAGWGGIANPEELTVHLFPGADNRFELYEDDGETQAYRAGAYAITPFALTWHGDRLEFVIAPATGDLAQIPPQRTYRLVLRGVRQPDDVRIAINDGEHGAPFSFDDATETLTVAGVALRPADTLRLTVMVRSGTLLSRRDRRPEICRKLLRAFRTDTEVKRQIDNDLPGLLAGCMPLQKYGRALSDAQMGALASVL